MALILNPKLQCQSPNVTQKNKCVQLKCKTSNIKKPHHFHLNTFIPHIKKNLQPLFLMDAHTMMLT